MEAFEVVRDDRLLLPEEVLGHEHLGAAVGAHGHHGGLGERGRAVVHRDVRDLHLREARDVRLVLEARLQHALEDLGLVGRVARVELAAQDERVDRRGHVVRVASGAQEVRALVEGRVLREHALHLAEHVQLGAPLREAQRRAHVLGNVGEELLDVLEAQLVQHGLLVGLAREEVGHPQVASCLIAT